MTLKTFLELGRTSNLPTVWSNVLAGAVLSGGAVSEPTLEDRRDLILQHFRWVADREPRGFALHKLRKFTSWYTHGLPNGRKLRQRINDLPDTGSFLQAVEDFFGELLLQPETEEVG